MSPLKIAILLVLRDHGPLPETAVWNALQGHSWISVCIAITELEIDGLAETVSPRSSAALVQVTAQGRDHAALAQPTQEVPIGSI